MNFCLSGKSVQQTDCHSLAAVPVWDAKTDADVQLGIEIVSIAEILIAGFEFRLTPVRNIEEGIFMEMQFSDVDGVRRSCSLGGWIHGG